MENNVVIFFELNNSTLSLLYFKIFNIFNIKKFKIFNLYLFILFIYKYIAIDFSLQIIYL